MKRNENDANLCRDPSVAAPAQETSGSDANGDRQKGRFDKIAWPAYDLTHQKYVYLGMKPKVKDHYHAHRLSLWNHLIPLLHRWVSDEQAAASQTNGGTRLRT